MLEACWIFNNEIQCNVGERTMRCGPSLVSQAACDVNSCWLTELYTVIRIQKKLLFHFVFTSKITVFSPILKQYPFKCNLLCFFSEWMYRRDQSFCNMYYLRDFSSVCIAFTFILVNAQTHSQKVKRTLRIFDWQSRKIRTFTECTNEKNQDIRLGWLSTPKSKMRHRLQRKRGKDLSLRLITPLVACQVLTQQHPYPLSSSCPSTPLLLQ